ncbi:MAG TPA: nucleoside hydrolase [archaeon]|nr:nucleoside hydrolase [archaeon]
MAKKTVQNIYIAILYSFLLFPAMAISGEGPLPNKIKIIIDTDIGEDVDDALIVAFALNSRDLDVLAVTTVDGPVQARSRITRRLTQAYGRPEIPVAAGYVWNMPWPDNHDIAKGGLTQGDLAPDETGLPPAYSGLADELIARLADKFPGEVYLLTLGSKTNVGQLLVRYPHSASKLKAIVSSGGFMTPEGFSGILVPMDWNFRYDPLASAAIMRSTVPWVITPSQTVNSTGGLPWEQVERLRQAGLPTTELLVRSIELWLKNKPDHAPYPHIADLSAFAWVMGGWLTAERYNVAMLVPPDGQVGQIRLEKDPHGRALVANPLPAEKGPILRELFMERLLASPIAGSN